MKFLVFTAFVLTACLVMVSTELLAKGKKSQPAQRSDVTFRQALDQCRKLNGGASTVLVERNGSRGWRCVATMAGMNGGK